MIVNRDYWDEVQEPAPNLRPWVDPSSYRPLGCTRDCELLVFSSRHWLSMSAVRSFSVCRTGSGMCSGTGCFWHWRIRSQTTVAGEAPDFLAEQIERETTRLANRRQPAGFLGCFGWACCRSPTL